MTKSTNEKIQNTGEKIGGSRKDFAEQRMRQSDIEEMTDAEMSNNITRDNVWPKPDFEKLVSEGTPADVAAAIKLIRDRIIKAPKVSSRRDHSTTLNWYFETLSQTRDYLESCKTLDEIKSAYTHLQSTIGQKDADFDYFRSEGMYKVDVIRRGRQNPTYFSWKDGTKINEMISKGFPKPIPSWKKGYQVKDYDGCIYLLKGNIIVKKDFETTEAAWDWLKSSKENSKSLDNKEKKKSIPKRPHLELIERTGLPDWRSENDISPQVFIDEFGFRGVEFGEWLPNDERQSVLNFAYDAFMDLSLATGLEPGQLSLNGTLALAFGARGNGTAAAHYEADRRVINLTRISGSGSLSHEWGHGLDHFIGIGSRKPMEIPSFTGWRKRLNSYKDQLIHHGEEINSAGQELLGSLFYRPIRKADRLAEIEQNIEKVNTFIPQWQKAIDAEEAKDKPDRKTLRQHIKGLEQNLEYLRKHERYKSDALAAADDAVFGKMNSLFVDNAAAISGANGYWARPNELFARSFESFIYDHIENIGGKSDYLVSHVDEKLYATENYRGNPYPTGEERIKINENYCELMRLCKPLIENKAVIKNSPMTP